MRKNNQTVDMSHNDVYIDEINKKIKNNDRIIFTAGTGLGKSYVSKKVVETSFENSDVLIVSPSLDLISQWKKNFSNLTNVKFCTYQKIKSLYKYRKKLHYDLIVLDEAHHLGAPVWGNMSFKLADSMKSKVIGLTATPLRHSDGKNVVELFDEHIEGIDTPEAIEQKILPQFIYVSCWYDIKGIIDRIQRDIDEGLLSKTYEKKLDLIRNLPSIETVIKDNMPPGQRKILVFYSSYKELERAQETMKKIYPKAAEWVVSYKYADKQNKKHVSEFEASKKKICILYSINKFNEGLHLDVVNTGIMFRKTRSYRIFIQEAGRLLSISTANKKDHILFDFVGNRYNIDIMDDSQSRYLDDILKLERDFSDHKESYSLATIPKDYTENAIKVLKEIRDMIYRDKEAIKIFCDEVGTTVDNFVRIMKKYHYTPDKVMAYYRGEIPNPSGNYFRKNTEDDVKTFLKARGIRTQTYRSLKNRTKYSKEDCFKYFDGEIPDLEGNYYRSRHGENKEVDKARKEFCERNNINYYTFIQFIYKSGWNDSKVRKYFLGEIPNKNGYYYNTRVRSNSKKAEDKVKQFCDEMNISKSTFLSFRRRSSYTDAKCFKYFRQEIPGPNGTYFTRKITEEEKQKVRDFCDSANIPKKVFDNFKGKTKYPLEKCFQYFKGEIPAPSGRYYKSLPSKRKKK